MSSHPISDPPVSTMIAHCDTNSYRAILFDKLIRHERPQDVHARNLESKRSEFFPVHTDDNYHVRP